MSSSRDDGRRFRFDPFELDPADQRLWREGESIHLGRKALGVLQCLVERAGRLVTKEELLQAVWPETAVGEAVLTTAVRELRQALGDSARAPRYVETVHGRGYRFLVAIEELGTPAAVSRSDRARLVGREAEERRLAEWHANARAGRRCIGFVAGEAGIGKTSLVEVFLGRPDVAATAWLGRGQCVEHYGAGEAYLPLLEAFARLGRDHGPVLTDVLRQYAPSWLVHLPGLVPVAARQAATPATPEKMLRELAEALEVLTAERLLVLVLEDLHWSDTATLELLAYVARRRDPARLLVLATYRPVEALLSLKPLRRLVAELRQDAQCDELILDFIDRSAVELYLRERCPDVDRTEELAAVLHARTGGHPLFLTSIVDELRRRAPVGAKGGAFEPEAVQGLIPSSMRQFIEHRLDLLPRPDRAALEAASVAGDPFTAAAIAGSRDDAETVEERCSVWCGDGGFLSSDGTVTYPDGQISARYRFRHALFQEVLYQRISPARRARLHRQIGERLESAWQDDRDIIAAELAVHFEAGREPRRSIAYRLGAARRALGKGAYSEARGHLDRGLALAKGLPEGRERLQHELELSLVLGQVLAMAEGWGAEATARVYVRLRELCHELEDDSRLPSVIWGQMAVAVVRARLSETRALSRELLTLARRQQDRTFELAAHMELGGTALLCGDLQEGREHLDRANLLYEPQQHARHLELFGLDVGLFARAWRAQLLWLVGRGGLAVAEGERVLKRCDELSHPLSQAVGLAYVAMLHLLRRDLARCEEVATATLRHSREHGFPYYLAWAEILHGSCRVGRGDDTALAELQRGLGVLREIGGVRLPLYRALLAEAYLRLERSRDALDELDEALADVERTGERWWLPELHRLRGVLLFAEQRESEARDCLSRAIEIARAQGSMPLEQRAAASLARLWHRQGRQEEASRLLQEVAQRLGDGLEAADLEELQRETRAELV